ncbi:MAG: hypothetical protein R3A10_13685 [Caldilineaceae bacterium]
MQKSPLLVHVLAKKLLAARPVHRRDADQDRASARLEKADD